MLDWSIERPEATAKIRFRLDSGEWKELKLNENETTLAETREGQTIEVENEGPEIVTIDGRFDRTEVFEEHGLGETKITGHTLCGHPAGARVRGYVHSVRPGGASTGACPCC